MWVVTTDGAIKHCSTLLLYIINDTTAVFFLYFPIWIVLEPQYLCLLYIIAQQKAWLVKHNYYLCRRSFDWTLYHCHYNATWKQFGGNYAFLDIWFCLVECHIYWASSCIYMLEIIEIDSVLRHNSYILSSKTLIHFIVLLTSV